VGGYGSGRRSTKPKVEECSSIDANQLNRDGCLKNGWNGTTTWSRNGQKFSSIGMRATADYLHLGYSSEQYGSVIQPIRIERHPAVLEAHGPTSGATVASGWLSSTALVDFSCVATALAYSTSARTKVFGIDLYGSEQSISSA